jgi:putative ATP-binding cassette transporter
MFSENYETFLINEYNKDLELYIALMKLKGTIKINSTENKLEIELSRGQQKRLALIYALLEDKDLLILDEWAADQDPQFRTYFYKVFLKELIKIGKTIIMVTHDDFHYKYADRIVKFDFGEIISDDVIRPASNNLQMNYHD